MFSTCFLYALDTAAFGRIDEACLPQQVLMELIVSELVNTDSFNNELSEFHEISRWKGVEINETDGMTKIKWGPDRAFVIQERRYHSSIQSGGCMDLGWLPTTVTDFSISFLQIQGAVETSRLPRGLKVFNIVYNQFSGTFSVEGLPAQIEQIFIDGNVFCGTLNIAEISSNVHHFEASNNEFSGSINLLFLPDEMKTL